MPRKLECSKCGKEKERIEHSYCDECARQYRAQHFQRNKSAYYASVRRKRERLSTELAKLKDRPCTDCGNCFHPWQMAFDHLPGFKKKYDVSIAVNKAGRRGVMAEAAKCEIVCLNCHADRTHDRRMNNKVKYIADMCG